MGKLDTKNKFNGGVEFEEDYGVNLYSTFYRKYDPQIGKFSGVDCQSEASMGMSVYQFAGKTSSEPTVTEDGKVQLAGIGQRFVSLDGPGWRRNGDPYKYEGGSVQNRTNDEGGKYAVFKYSNNGNYVVFPGVTITDFMVKNGTGYTTLM